MVKITGTWDDGSKITTYTNSTVEAVNEVEALQNADAEIVVEILDEMGE